MVDVSALMNVQLHHVITDISGATGLRIMDAILAGQRDMLRYGKQYVDVGADYYEKQYRERVLKNLTKRAAQFGLALTPAVSGSTNHAGPG